MPVKGRPRNARREFLRKELYAHLGLRCCKFGGYKFNIPTEDLEEIYVMWQLAQHYKTAHAVWEEKCRDILDYAKKLAGHS